jgi:uncharacterized membrane protein
VAAGQRIEPIAAPNPVVASGTGPRSRLESIDILRGIVMVFMALDHIKHTFMIEPFDPMNPDVTTFGYYMTRWITHFCAPTFCFLMGTGAYLAGRRGKTTLELFWFLFSRGVWLLFLEFTIVKLGMFFEYKTTIWMGVVLWSLGTCLIFLSTLVFLPTRVIAVIGVIMIVAHNLFDNVRADSLGVFRPLWIILHQGGEIELAEGVKFVAAYPMIPWIGVAAVGYAFGSIYGVDPKRRQRIILGLGSVLTLGFLVLRVTNVYGDPNAWSGMSTEIKASTQEVAGKVVAIEAKPSVPRSAMQTTLSFFNTNKYPPSLLFLMMTLGPALIVLALLEKYPPSGVLSRILLTYGRVPLFYWLIHWFVIQFLVRGVTLARGFSLMDVPGMPPPDAAKYSLPMVYFWLFVVLAILYLPCRWFAGVKARNKQLWWLSYL